MGLTPQGLVLDLRLKRSRLFKKYNECKKMMR
jgi:hypothetical protein